MERYVLNISMWFVQMAGPLSANVIDSVLKNSVQISVASWLCFVYGELLPLQAFPLLSQTEEQYNEKAAWSTWCFRSGIDDCVGDEGTRGHNFCTLYSL